MATTGTGMSSDDLILPWAGVEPKPGGREGNAVLVPAVFLAPNCKPSGWVEWPQASWPVKSATLLQLGQGEAIG